MPRPAESHSRGEQSVCISVDKCVHVRVSLHIASCARECLGACTPERVCDFSRRDECVWHQCVFSIKGEIKPKKLRMTIHTEAANRGLTQILQEPSPLFFFFLFPSPKSKHLSSCLAFICATWEQTPQRNSRAQTTTTATATTQRSSKQRRRLDISLFSSQETKWLPNAVWRQITRAWATEMTVGCFLWRASRILLR